MTVEFDLNSLLLLYAINSVVIVLYFSFWCAFFRYFGFVFCLRYSWYLNTYAFLKMASFLVFLFNFCYPLLVFNGVLWFLPVAVSVISGFILNFFSLSFFHCIISTFTLNFNHLLLVLQLNILNSSINPFLKFSSCLLVRHSSVFSRFLKKSLWVQFYLIFCIFKVVFYSLDTGRTAWP